MRKLLSLLTVLTLTTPVPLNVIACGGTKTPPVVDDTDYLTLKQTAEDKIQTEFANLVNDGSNLWVEGNFEKGSDIMTYLRGISKKIDTNIKSSDSKVTVDGFLEILKAQVVKISTNLVDKYPELKPLFNGVNPNERLKINTDNLDQIFTNKVFNWDGNDFGINNFDAKDKPYNVKEWFHLNANLTLNLTCLGEDAKINTVSISPLSYDMYFANDGSRLDDVVNVVTKDVKGKLEKQKVVNVEYSAADPFNDSFVNKKKSILDKIKAEFKSIIPKVNIATTQLTNVKDYHYMNRWGGFSDSLDKKDYNPLTMNNLQKYLDSSDEFDKAWQPLVNNRLKDFKTVLEKWIADNKLAITNPDNIFVIGNYQTTNWSIDGLELKTITIPYYVSGDKTRDKDTRDSLDIVDKLFVGTNPLFKYPNNISGFAEAGDITFFNFNILSTDFNNFVENDDSLQAIYDYITIKTTTFLAKQNISGNIAWVTSNTFSTQQKISDIKGQNALIITKNQIRSLGAAFLWRLNINGNAFGFSINNNNHQEPRFSITSSDSAIWPS